MKLFNVATSNILLLRRDKTSMTQSSKPAEEPEPPPWRLAETSTKFTKIAQPKTHGNWTFMIVKRWMHHNQRPNRRGNIENPRRCSEKRKRVERDTLLPSHWVFCSNCNMTGVIFISFQEKMLSGKLRLMKYRMQRIFILVPKNNNFLLFLFNFIFHSSYFDISINQENKEEMSTFPYFPLYP